MFGTLYTFVPYERPKWREVLPAALLAALMFELAKVVFGLYIDNVARLHAVYGPLSSVIVLLLWLYFSAKVLLLGAEMIAVRREQDDENPATPSG